MRRKTLFIILCITTLTFLGCGKTETPVMSNSVETEVETKEETSTQNEVITEEVKTEKVENEESTDNNQKDTETTRPINEETDSNSENLENLKMMLEEGVPPFQESPTCVSPFQRNLFSLHCLDVQAEDRLPPRVHVGQPWGKASWESLVGKTRGKTIDALIHGADCVTLLLPLWRKAQVHARIRDED